MMWPFWRRDPRPSDEAMDAVAHADRFLLDVQNLDSRVDQAAREAADIKRQNHIAAAVAKSIRGE